MPNSEVDHRAKRLHQIVHQTHGVVVVAVVQTDAGVQTRCAPVWPLLSMGYERHLWPLKLPLVVGDFDDAAEHGVRLGSGLLRNGVGLHLHTKRLKHLEHRVKAWLGPRTECFV